MHLLTDVSYTVNMSEEMAAKRDQILASALGVFGRYGYKRTSMDLIAQAAGVSRPALYQHFNGKADVFRAAADRMLDELIAAAEAGGRSATEVADRLYGALVVKLDFFVGTVEAEFRSEMVVEAGTIAAEVMASFKQRHLAVVQTVLTSAADELDLLGTALPAHDAAALLLDALNGISQDSAPPEILHARLRQLVELTVRGLTRHRG